MPITEIRSYESCDNPVEDIEGVRTIEGVETQHTPTVHDDRYYSISDRISSISASISDRRTEFQSMFSGAYNERIRQTFRSKLKVHLQDISEFLDQNKSLLPYMSQDNLQNHVETVDKLLTDLLKLKEVMKNKYNLIMNSRYIENRSLYRLEEGVMLKEFSQNILQPSHDSGDPVTVPSYLTNPREAFLCLYDQCLPKLVCHYNIISGIYYKLLSHKEAISTSGESQIPPSRPLSERRYLIDHTCLYETIQGHIPGAGECYTQVSEASSRYLSAKSESENWVNTKTYQ